MTSVYRMHTFYLTIVVFTCILMPSSAMDTSFKPGRRPEGVPFRSLPNLSFGECRNECIMRPRCRSVAYRRLVAFCLLYERDSSGIGTVVDTKMTYSEKKEWSVTPLSTSCSGTCKQTEVCRVRGANPTSCSIEECGAPEYITGASQQSGNVRGVGNMVISTCKGSVTTKIQRECDKEGNWLQVYPNYHTVSSNIKYEGCFLDRQNRALTGLFIFNRCMTITYCAEYCFTRQFKYFGLESYSHCFCGAVMHYRILTDNCNTPCIGNRDEMCGGPWALSMYTYRDVPT